jgi:DnaK suppressor protein
MIADDKSPSWAEPFRAALLAEQRRLQQAMADANQPSPTEDPAGFDDGSYLAEADRSVRLRMQQIALLREIEHALGKLEAGTYGLCDVCNRPIPVERLTIRPQSASCVGCKRRDPPVDAQPVM